MTSDSATLEAVLSDADSLSYSDQLRLAHKLFSKDELSHVLPSINTALSRDNSSDREQFRKFLREVINDAMPSKGPHDIAKVSLQIKLRIFFETLMAWDVIARPTLREKLGDRLEESVAAMEAIIPTKGPSGRAAAWNEELAEQFWYVDGQFHLAICGASKHGHLTQYIEMILEECRAFGTAASITRAKKTLTEHKNISRAIKSGDREAVFKYVRIHVEEGVGRWLERMKKEKEEEDKKSGVETELMPGIWVTKTRDRSKSLGGEESVTMKSERKYAEQLPSLLSEKEGSWVAYYDGVQIGEVVGTEEQLRLIRDDYCKKNDVPQDDVVCHRIMKNSSIDHIPRF